ncbi:MAG: ribonuclease P protein component [Prevotellaceae bacterium]|jgi:ribonuclease P protein component|nr:ribonuclease P protein component [Prevotellaceae bacterium]
MPDATATYTLRKAERLYRRNVIDRLFAGGAHSFVVYPLRIVYVDVETLEAPVSILISVSKRRFKRAVKRNRMKRRIREAYRKQKTALVQSAEEQHRHLAVAFIYLTDKLVDSAAIEASMKTALTRIREQIGS